jgi:hypothetical protein
MRIRVNKDEVYTVIADGILSIPNFADGRLIPGILIDVKDNLKIPEIIKLHDSLPPGDVEYHWAKKTFHPESLLLKINYKAPMQAQFAIEFLIPRRFAVIEGIIQSRSVYLALGKEGDKFSDNIDNGMVFEVPDMGIDKDWEKVLIRTLIKKNRKEGYNKRDSVIVAREQAKILKERWRFRRPFNGRSPTI